MVLVTVLRRLSLAIAVLALAGSALSGCTTTTGSPKSTGSATTSGFHGALITPFTLKRSTAQATF